MLEFVDIALYAGCAVVLGTFLLSLRGISLAAEEQRHMEKELNPRAKLPDDLLR